MWKAPLKEMILKTLLILKFCFLKFKPHNMEADNYPLCFCFCFFLKMPLHFIFEPEVIIGIMKFIETIGKRTRQQFIEREIISYQVINSVSPREAF